MMKRIWYMVPVIFLMFSHPSAQAQIDVEQVIFDKDVYDFGEVSFGNTPINATFIFTNNSEFNYEIKDVLASCGCTVPSWPKNPIPPGKKGVITAKFDPSNLAGEVDKSIEIFANYNKVPSKILYIRGIINKPLEQDYTKYIPGQMGYLRTSKQVVGFGDVLNTKKYVQDVLMVNDYNRPLRIKGIDKKPVWADVTISKMEVVPGDTVLIQITVDGSKINDLGLINDQILISTNDNFLDVKELKLAMEVKQDFGKLKKRDIKSKPTIQFSQKTFDMGNIQKGAIKKQTFTITNSGKSNLEILKVKSDCGCTVLNNLKTSLLPGETASITLTFDSIFLEGKAEKEIILYTNDPYNQMVVLKVYAFVLEE